MNWEIERFLRGAEVGALLERAVMSSGLELQDWALERVYSRPNAETSARFTVRAGGTALTLVASTRRLSADERAKLGAVRCTSEVGTLHIWAYPIDPELPGLRIVEDPVQLASRLGQFLEAEVQIEQSKMLVLRPLRRAVYRVVVSSDHVFRTVFLKVLRPHKVPELLERHQACSLIPAAADVGDGILVVDQAPGVAMNQLLHMPSSPNPGVEISADGVLSALDTITSRALTLPARTPPAGRFANFIDIAVAGGADRRRVTDLVDAIHRQLARSGQGTEPSHGDFHPGNLFLTEDGLRPMALIDVDTLGPGRRIDDIAMMLAHLMALPSFDAAGYSTAAATAQEIWKTAAPSNSADLGARAAASLLCLVSGARSTEQLRCYIATAENLLNSRVIPVTQHAHDAEL